MGKELVKNAASLQTPREKSQEKHQEENCELQKGKHCCMHLLK